MSRLLRGAVPVMGAGTEALSAVRLAVGTLPAEASARMLCCCSWSTLSNVRRALALASTIVVSSRAKS